MEVKLNFVKLSEAKPPINTYVLCTDGKIIETAFYGRQRRFGEVKIWSRIDAVYWAPLEEFPF